MYSYRTRFGEQRKIFGSIIGHSSRGSHSSWEGQLKQSIYLIDSRINTKVMYWPEREKVCFTKLSLPFQLPANRQLSVLTPNFHPPTLNSLLSRRTNHQPPTTINVQKESSFGRLISFPSHLLIKREATTWTASWKVGETGQPSI